uniref:Ganglioside GM2 activator n=1 Tax=Magallana gigas TaxID=29159 RepID=K1PHC8_MAGGI
MLPKVSVLLAVWSVVRTCDDVNTVACGQLDRVMNVCTDPCFSNLCPRYCGKCPVKCYHCVSGNQADCTEIEECPNMEYACIHERFLTTGECRDHRGFCCKSDLCNNDATSQRTGRRRYIETDGNDQRRAANRNDTVECSSCHRVDRPEDCNMTTVCDPDEMSFQKCYTLKTRSTDGTYAYNLGCLHQKGCDTLHESAPHALGRSDSIDITIEGHCCSGNLCNQVKPTACFAPTTAHPYVTFTSLSVSPSPVVIPGNITIGVQGTIHHHFGNDVKMVVHMDKMLLGQWTKFPCSQNFGSCNLDNPCELLSAFVLGNGCPCALLFSGIPCTCPFNPLSINLPPTVFEIRRVNEHFRYFSTVSFYSVFLVQQLYYVLTPIFIL